jgi:HK97 family phage portal protein
MLLFNPRLGGLLILAEFLKKFVNWILERKARRAEKRLVRFDRSPALIARSVSLEDLEPVKYGTIRQQLVESTLINGRELPKIGVAYGLKAEYPPDYNDYEDYYDAYFYVPFVSQALTIRHLLIWQNGFDTESKDEKAKKKADQFMAQINADVVLQKGTLHGLITGNCYWLGEKQADGLLQLKVLDSRKVLYAKDGKGFIYIKDQKPKAIPELTPQKTRGILHLPFNNLTGHYGTSCLRRVLPTVKSLLYMERYMPKIVRKRGDPLLAIKIDTKDPEEFRRIKQMIITRKEAEDIFHDGTIEIEEVYKSTPRFGVMEVVKHFRDNLVAGLGVPEVALGFGGTTTMATAEYQERLLIGELQGYQRQIKRFIEQKLFPLADIKNVKVNWRPIKPEDTFALSKRYCQEIEHGIVSPSHARQLLGYPPEAGEETVIRANLIPYLQDLKTKQM